MIENKLSLGTEKIILGLKSDILKGSFVPFLKSKNVLPATITLVKIFAIFVNVGKPIQKEKNVVKSFFRCYFKS